MAEPQLNRHTRFLALGYRHRHVINLKDDQYLILRLMRILCVYATLGVSSTMKKKMVSVMKEIYLDNSATTFPKPQAVCQAVESFMRCCGGSPGRGSHKKAREADEIVLGARQSVARLFGVTNPSRITFSSNCTESLNLAIKGIVQAGQHVVITDLEHNAVSRPLWKLKERMGIEISVIKTAADGILDPSAVERAIQNNTVLICCVHANNVMGTILPIADIAQIARKNGIYFLVDAAQSAGVLPLKVEEIGIDLLAFTGHKGLFGPQGTGGLYIREGVDVQSLKEGGTGIRSESLEQPVFAPEGYEAGTLNAPGLAGLKEGVDFVLDQGLDKIWSHEALLNNQFIQHLKNIDGVQIYGPEDPERKVAITSINLQSLDAAHVGELLDRKFGIMVRTGLQCSALTHHKLKTDQRGVVRFSFGYFNTLDDVSYTADALRQIARALYLNPESSWLQTTGGTR